MRKIKNSESVSTAELARRALVISEKEQDRQFGTFLKRKDVQKLIEDLQIEVHKPKSPFAEALAKLRNVPRKTAETVSSSLIKKALSSLIPPNFELDRVKLNTKKGIHISLKEKEKNPAKIDFDIGLRSFNVNLRIPFWGPWAKSSKKRPKLISKKILVEEKLENL